MKTSGDAYLRAVALRQLRDLIDVADKNRKNPIRWQSYADSAAIALAEASSHNATGVALLCEQTADLVIPATAAARAALEAGVKCAWLLEPIEPARRTERWLQYRANHLQIMKHWRDLAVDDEPEMVQGLDAAIQFHGDFLKWQAQKAGLDAVEGRPPSFESMLRSIKSSELYTWYREASQLVHAELTTLGLCLRSGPRIGSFVEPCHWAIPLSLAAMGLVISSRHISITLMERRSDIEAVEAAYHSVLDSAVALYTYCLGSTKSEQEALYLG